MPQSHLQGGKVLRQLIEGNQRWVDATPQINLRDATRRSDKLVDFQDPHAVIITCSDSRVIPEFMFDSNVGDLFVIRVAGNVITPEILASVEFACEELHSSLVIVLGHQNCGAVAAKLSLKGNENLGENMQALIDKIEINGDYNAAIAHNAKQQVSLIPQQSNLIGKYVEEGRVVLKSAVYQMDSRKVEILD